MTEYFDKYGTSQAKQDNLDNLTKDYNAAMEKGGNNPTPAVENESQYNSKDDVAEGYNPFDGNGTQVATLITLMRIYDVQLALLSLQNDELAEAITDKHAAGEILASFPQISM